MGLLHPSGTDLTLTFPQEVRQEIEDRRLGANRSLWRKRDARRQRDVCATRERCKTGENCETGERDPRRRRSMTGRDAREGESRLGEGERWRKR
ncbi:hypothetical protein MRB53_016148 [Persea americana]|uniref:Uncharacterized protein n=1 Tax=Persea americana TaxID=3435 RepID=A0ACC2M1I6_PERAE|nr:hypothetical protein MRB53_016148 [Persea americana]